MNINITAGELLTVVVLLVTIFNSWQNSQMQLKIAKLQLWIVRNFVTKPDSIIKEYDPDA